MSDVIMSDFPLTPRQMSVFKVLKKYYKKYKFMPTQREIKKDIKIKSDSVIIDCLKALEEKGFIERRPGGTRQIRILKDI